MGLICLAGLLLVGIGLRLWCFLCVRPAMMGYSDTHAYIGMASAAASGRWFTQGGFPEGYPAFLAVLHAVVDRPSFVPVVQHGLGVATALLAYASLRRLGAPVWVGLVPAAVVLLLGAELFLEQSILSETLFGFLVVAAVYCAVRSSGSSRPWWPLATGVLVALTPLVRFVGIALVPVFVVWLMGCPGPLRLRLVRVAAVAGAAIAVLAGYNLFAAHQQTISPAHAQRVVQASGAGASWPLYARVAGFADCRRFRPPPGTLRLCERTPPQQRQTTVDDYLYNPSLSPALEVAPQGGVIHTVPQDRITAFAHAVIRAQPLDYLKAILADLRRWVRPTAWVSGRAQDWEAFLDQTVDATRPSFHGGVATEPVDFRPFYPRPGVAYRENLLRGMRSYERVTRVRGPLTIVLAVLALLTPLLGGGRTRWSAVLLVLVTLVLVVVPVAALFWHPRYVVPAVAPLAMTAGLGAWGLGELRQRRFAPAMGPPIRAT